MAFCAECGRTAQVRLTPWEGPDLCLVCAGLDDAPPKYTAGDLADAVRIGVECGRAAERRAIEEEA